MHPLPNATLALLLALSSIAGCASTPAPAPTQSSATRSVPPPAAIASLDAAATLARELAAEPGARVLVVYDIDSTLLRATRRWPELDALEARSGDSYRQLERTLMYLSVQAPTEPTAAATVAALQVAGIDAYALTARGTDMRDMTLRELAANDFAFPAAPECGPPLCMRRGTLSPDAVMATAQSVVGDATLAQLDFTRGRAVSVSEGVVMASGLHKGVVLQLLLASLPVRYDAVVFVDDLQRNIDEVHAAARAIALPVHALHYVPQPRPPSLPGDRRTAEREGAAMRTAICTALAPRWCADADAAAQD